MLELPFMMRQRRCTPKLDVAGGMDRALPPTATRRSHSATRYAQAQRKSISITSPNDEALYSCTLESAARQSAAGHQPTPPRFTVPCVAVVRVALFRVPLVSA